MDDLVKIYDDDVSIVIKDDSAITMKTTSHALNNKPSLQIDWATALDHQNLVLYRRIIRSSNPKDILYYPICDYLDTFNIKMLNSQGDPAENQSSAALIEVTATVFREDIQDPEYGLTSRRTFSLNRFDF